MKPNRATQKAINDDDYAAYLAALWEERPKDRPVLRCPVCKEFENQGVYGAEHDYERRSQQKVIIATTYRFKCGRCGNCYDIKVDRRDWPGNHPWSPPSLRYRSGGRAPFTAKYQFCCLCDVKLALSKGDIIPSCPDCQATICRIIDPPD